MHCYQYRCCTSLCSSSLLSISVLCSNLSTRSLLQELQIALLQLTMISHQRRPPSILSAHARQFKPSSFRLEASSSCHAFGRDLLDRGQSGTSISAFIPSLLPSSLPLSNSTSLWFSCIHSALTLQHACHSFYRRSVHARSYRQRDQESLF